jgi:hypothetical protein
MLCYNIVITVLCLSHVWKLCAVYTCRFAHASIHADAHRLYPAPAHAGPYAKLLLLLLFCIYFFCSAGTRVCWRYRTWAQALTRCMSALQTSCVRTSHE